MGYLPLNWSSLANQYQFQPPTHIVVTAITHFFQPQVLPNVSHLPILQHVAECLCRPPDCTLIGALVPLPSNVRWHPLH